MQKIDLRKISYSITYYSPCIDVYVDFGNRKVVKSTLSKDEIRQTESLLLKSFKAYNRRVEKDFPVAEELFSSLGKMEDFQIDPKDYYRQYVPVVDEQGNKFVHVQAITKQLAKSSPEWKTELLQIYDGGSCVFRCLINLSKNRAGKGSTFGYFF
ncbi:hypothetical protein [Labilibaculum sp.]|uniref:hypothetical protein n=1 Tax=Labilibaculum sp. TaxID=2060723 RepID=UPI0035682FDD